MNRIKQILAYTSLCILLLSLSYFVGIFAIEIVFGILDQIQQIVGNRPIQEILNEFFAFVALPTFIGLVLIGGFLAALLKLTETDENQEDTTYE